MDDLKAMLERMGIAPLGMEPVDGVYTLHMEVAPPVSDAGEQTEPLDREANDGQP